MCALGWEAPGPYTRYLQMHTQVLYYAYMNWEDIRLFDAVASFGSISAGAKSLDLSQPQMSRRLRGLEEQLGARLFDRTPQGLRPTPAGSKLIPLAAEMRGAAEQIERAKPDLAAKSLTVVRISVDEIRERFLTSNLSGLQESLDGLEIEIFSGHEHLDHQSRETDIQVRSCLPDSETLVAKRLGRTGYGLYATREFFKMRGCEPSPTDIKTLPWIGISPDHLWYPTQLKWLENFFENSSVIRCNTMTAILNAALGHCGIAMLPHFMAREHKEFVEIQIAKSNVLTVEYLIVHRDLLRERAVRATVTAVANLYKTHKQSLVGV